MTITLTKPNTQVVWRSPDPGAKTTSIPGSVVDNKGYALNIKSTLADGSTYIVTPTSGTIGGANDFIFTEPEGASCNLSLISDADNADWVIRCLCCLPIDLADAVYFDQLKHGYYTTESTGHSSLLSFSFWIAFGRLATAASIIHLDSAGTLNNPGLSFQTGSGSNNTLRLILVNTGATNGIAFNFNVPNDGLFHNILGSIRVDTNPCVADIYVDETHTNGSQSTPPFTIDFSGGFALPDFPDSFASAFTLHRTSTACVGDLWWAPGQFVDFTNPTNRAKFHDLTTHAPVAVSALGARGELPTGAQPVIFMTGAKASFGANRGTGPKMTLMSPVEDCLDGLHTTLPTKSSRAGIAFHGSGKQMGGDIISPHPNSAVMTYSVWVRFATNPIAVNSLLSATNQIHPAAYLFKIQIETTRLVTAYFTNAANSLNITFSQTTNAIPADGAWHHLIFSVNTQTGVMGIVVDRNYSTASVTSGGSGFDIGYLQMSGWSVFGDTSLLSTDTFLGDAAELWVDITTGFDLTDSGVLDLWEQGGRSVDLGVDGSNPLEGDTPSSYHSQRPIGYESITFFANRSSGPFRPVFIAEYPGASLPPTVAASPNP